MILVHLYNKTQMEPQDEGLLEDPFAIKVSGSPLVTSRATKMLAKGSPQSILNCCTTVSCLRLKTWCVFILVPSNCVFKKNHLFEAASRMKLVAWFVKLPMIQMISPVLKVDLLRPKGLHDGHHLTHAQGGNQKTAYQRAVQNQTTNLLQYWVDGNWASIARSNNIQVLYVHTCCKTTTNGCCTHTVIIQHDSTCKFHLRSEQVEFL